MPRDSLPLLEAGAAALRTRSCTSFSKGDGRGGSHSMPRQGLRGEAPDGHSMPRQGLLRGWPLGLALGGEGEAPDGTSMSGQDSPCSRGSQKPSATAALMTTAHDILWESEPSLAATPACHELETSGSCAWARSSSPPRTPDPRTPDPDSPELAAQSSSSSSRVLRSPSFLPPGGADRASPGLPEDLRARAEEMATWHPSVSIMFAVGAGEGGSLLTCVCGGGAGAVGGQIPGPQAEAAHLLGHAHDP